MLVERYADFINVCITENFTASSNVREYVGEMIDAMVFMWPKEVRYIINNMIELISDNEKIGHSYRFFFDYSHFRFQHKVIEFLILTTLKVVTFYGSNFTLLCSEGGNK